MQSKNPTDQHIFDSKINRMTRKYLHNAKKKKQNTREHDISHWYS